MNFIECYGCGNNEGLEDIGFLSSENEVFRFESNTPLELCYEDVRDFYQHHEKEIKNISNCKDYKERFDNICRFLKEKRTFEYFLNNADKDYNGKHCRIHLWNIEILLQQKYIERFNVTPKELYLNYCNLIDKISEGAFNMIGENDMLNDCDHESWKYEQVDSIFMLPNGWFVCECSDVYYDDCIFCEYLYYDEMLLFVGRNYEWNSDIVDGFFEYQNTEDFKNHKAEKIQKIQCKYEKKGLAISGLEDVDYDDLIWLYKRQIAGTREYIYKSNCNWIQNCCEVISIIAQRLWRIDREKIKLTNSIEEDLHVDTVAKKLLLKELEKVLNIELNEKEFMDTDTIKDIFELVVHMVEKSEKRNIQLQNFS